MSARPAVSRHSIAFLQVVGEAEVQRKGHVFCPRQGGQVPLARCARCPRFVKVTPGDTAGQAAVHCRAGASAPSRSDRPLSLPRATVADLMTRDVVCVRPELTLDALTVLFLETSLAAIPVIEQDGRLLGFVSQDEAALAAQIARPEKRGPLTVGDVLLPFALAVAEDTTLTQAAAVMAFEGQQRLAVTSRDGAVVGVVTATDLLYWLARADGHVVPPLKY